MEQQFLDIKKQHPDTILFVEAGYRYRFFGKDAEIASKVLNIVASMSHNFLSTSVPTHRLFVHAKRFDNSNIFLGNNSRKQILRIIRNFPPPIQLRYLVCYV